MKPWQGLATLFALFLILVAWMAGASGSGDAKESHEGGHLAFRGQPVDLGRQGPRVGERIDDVAFVDLEGQPGRLANHLGEKGLVIAVRDAGCPLSRKYGPRLAQLEKQYGERGFGFLYFNPTRHDMPDRTVGSGRWRSSRWRRTWCTTCWFSSRAPRCSGSSAPGAAR